MGTNICKCVYKIKICENISWKKYKTSFKNTLTQKNIKLILFHSRNIYNWSIIALCA